MSEKILRKIYVIIPAFNEENSVGLVINELPKELIEEVIVVNNNSNDLTSEMALKAGATVLDEKIQGYGRSCLKGIEYIKEKTNDQDVVVFLDADYSDYPGQMIELVDPILNDDFQLVIGSRSKGKREKKSMTFAQVFGNYLACSMMKLFYGANFTDLGPFRAIEYKSLVSLNMQDTTYGWTVEMQVKAIKNKLKYTEVAVDYKKRIGFSKISGTIKGTVLAGYKIITTILKFR